MRNSNDIKMTNTKFPNNLRKAFEELKKEKTQPSQELENLVKDEEKNYPRYSSYSSGGLLGGLQIIDTHKINGIEAFILGKSYSIANAGVEASIDFGAIKGDNVYRRGFRMTRGGTANDVDDSHGAYNEVKIIEIKKGNAILGLYSGAALDFFNINFKNGFSERIKRYDLMQERMDKEKEELELKARQTEDFEEKLKTFSQKLYKEISMSREPFCEILEVGKKKLGIIAIETYDRDFDASTEDVHFYILEQGLDKPEKILTRHPDFDKSYKYQSRFFSVSARKEVSGNLILEKNGKLRIPFKLTIRGSWNCGYPGAASTSTIKEDSFELEYKLKKK